MSQAGGTSDESWDNFDMSPSAIDAMLRDAEAHCGGVQAGPSVPSVKSCEKADPICGNAAIEAAANKPEGNDGYLHPVKLDNDATNMPTADPVRSRTEDNSADAVAGPSVLKLVAVEGLPEAYINGLNKLMKTKTKDGEVRFVASFLQSPTHYIVDYYSQTGVIKSFDFYMAKCKGLWMLLPQWLDAIKIQGTIFAEELYEYKTSSALVVDERLTRKNRSLNLFEGRSIIFVDEYPLTGFQFSKGQMADLLNVLGAEIHFLRYKDINTELKKPVPSSAFTVTLRDAFIMATTNGFRHVPCNTLYHKFGWITIRPEYFLKCIEDNRVLDIPKSMLLTRKSIID